MVNKYLKLFFITTLCISCFSEMDNKSIKTTELIDKNDFIKTRKMQLDSFNGKYVIVSSEKFIKQNHLQNKVDSAKWIIYLTNILSKNKLYCFKVDSMGFGKEEPYYINKCPVSLDLYLTGIDIYKNAMFFMFSFLDEKENCLCNFPELNTTVGFIKGDNMIYRLGGEADYESFLNAYKLQKEAELEQREKIYDSPKSDYTIYFYHKILQTYLDTTNCKINSWFKEEALKRGYSIN